VFKRRRGDWAQSEQRADKARDMFADIAAGAFLCSVFFP
jgi:hypothetical protein